MSNRFQVTSLDPQDLKQSLIEFYKQNPDFQDFDYEGSTINTIIDLLVRNSHFASYEANMVANESFLDSSQIRGNASAHSQKLSWVPRSRTSARLTCDIKVTPTEQYIFSTITANAGSSFLRAIGGTTYTFTNPNAFVLFKESNDNFYAASDVELVQGQLVTNQFIYDNVNSSKVFIPNGNVDTSSIRVFIKTSPTTESRTEYNKVEDISEVSTNSNVFFLGETRNEQYYVEFGKNVLGNEPNNGDVVVIEYIVTEEEHANKVSQLVAGTTIGGFSDIDITVTTPAYGGADKSTIEEIKFIAPRAYQSQNRAVRESDYVVEIKKRFPFIKAANVWGGEKNDPPYYGRVFISVITDENTILTDTVKRDIEESLDAVNVVTISPQIVDTQYIDVDLNTSIIFNNKVTKQSFSDVSSVVSNTIEEYRNKVLEFDSYFNESELIDNIRASDVSVESVVIKKTAYVEIPIQTNTKQSYKFNFRNSIVEGSIKVSNIITDVTASNETVYDDDGIVYISKVINGSTIIVGIGGVNYETGLVEFSLTNISSGDLILKVEPEGANFYSDLQNVIRLNNNSIDRIIRDR